MTIHHSRKSWFYGTVTAIALAVAAGTVGMAGQVQAATLNVGMASQDAGQLDPHLSVTTPDKVLFGWMFSGLVRFKPGSIAVDGLEPDLAESWTSSDDGLVWTFTLRQGAQFHHGYGEVTADDVVFSLTRAGDPNTSSFASDYASVASIDAVDRYTVRITLSEPLPSLLSLVANYHGGNVVSKMAVEEMGEDFKTRPIGSGPFAFAEYRPNELVRLVAHEDYFRGTPKIDEIVYRYIPSDASRDFAFDAGEIDMIYGKQEQQWVDRIGRRDDTVVSVFQPAELSTFHLNLTRPPLDDIRVRQAVAHAIDRDELVAFRGSDVSQPATSIVPAGYLGQDPSAGLLPHDTEKAKALLAQAGHEDGITISAVQTTLPVMLTAMEVVQAQLAQAGITLDFELVDHPTFHKNIRQDLSQTVYYGAARFPIADTYLTQFYHSRSIVNTPTGVTNFSHCNDGDSEIDAARVEPDTATQVALWQEAQKKLVANVCSVPMFEALQVWALRDTIDLGYTLEGSMSLGPALTEQSSIAAD